MKGHTYLTSFIVKQKMPEAFRLMRLSANSLTFRVHCICPTTNHSAQALSRHRKNALESTLFISVACMWGSQSVCLFMVLNKSRKCKHILQACFLTGRKVNKLSLLFNNAVHISCKRIFSQKSYHYLLFWPSLLLYFYCFIYGSIIN